MADKILILSEMKVCYLVRLIHRKGGCIFVSAEQITGAQHAWQDENCFCSSDGVVVDGLHERNKLKKELAWRFVKRRSVRS
jgi:hypothetical protein